MLLRFPARARLALTLLSLPSLASLALSSSSCVQPTNPFDPETPAGLQAPGAVVGVVKLVDTTAASADDLAPELGAIEVSLVQDRAIAVDGDGAELSAPLDDVAEGAGRFELRRVIPGAYKLQIDGVGSRFDERPSFGTFFVGAGEEVDLGELEFRFAPADPNDGPGTIEGDVELVGGAGGARTVRLFRLDGDGNVVEVKSSLTDAAGKFAFTTGTGRFAVTAELDGFTPDYAFDLDVGEGAGQQLSFQLAGDSALQLNPVTAVLVPTAAPVEGIVYVNGADVELNVLAFGGVTGMRLSTDPAFGDGAGSLPFVQYAAATSVALPDVQGPVTVFAQFESRSAGGFLFTSPSFAVTVVRDTTAPRIESISAPSLGAADADGNVFVGAGDDDVGISIDAFDEHSAIRRALIVQPADNLEPAPGEDAFDDVFSPGGLVRYSDVVELTPGEGERLFYAFVIDRAGNLSPPATLRVVRDSLAPQLSVAVVEAGGGGVVSQRGVTLAFDEGSETDLPVSMRVGQAPLSPATPSEPYASTRALTLSGAHDDVVVVAAELTDAAGNVVVVETVPLRLSLTATIEGTVALEGVPALAADSGGVDITLSRDGIGVIDTTTSAADGSFAFPAVPEGAGYRITTERDGYRALAVAVAGGGAVLDGALVDVGALNVTLARGTIAGRMQRADLLADGGAHGLILVTATLTGAPGARSFVATAVTQEDGRFTLTGLPSTITALGEGYVVSGAAEGYARVELAPASVAADGTTTLADQQLAPLAGDFDLCAPPPAACNALLFSNLDELRVRVRETAGVTDIRVAVGAPPAGPFLPFDEAVPVLVDVSGAADGNVSIFVQTIVDGSTGVPLEAIYVRDTAPPVVGSFTRSADAGALDPRFTNDAVAAARIVASAGAGTVAPLVDAHFAFAAAPPSSPPAGAVRCASGDTCDTPLPTLPGGAISEQLHTLFAFACDAAGNCAAPASDFVIYDETAPSALHGVGFAPTGSNIVSFGGALHTRSSQYQVEIDVGHAEDGAGADVLDENGDPVRDVFGYRFAFSGAIDDVNLAQLASDPAPDASEIVDGLGLPAADGTYDVFALFVDAAGNASPVEPNPFSFALRLDTAPPQVSFALDAGAVTTRDTVVALTVTPGPSDPPVSALFTLDGGAFGTTTTPAPVPVPLQAPNNVVTLPAGDGLKSVHARFFDAAGNIAERAATIRLDGTAPTVTFARCASCVVDGGVTFTNSTNRIVTIDVVATDLAGAVPTIEVGVNGGARTPNVNDGTVQATLANVTTPQTVEIVAVDDAGNVSATVTLPITLDLAAPTLTAVVDGVEGAGFATAALTAGDANGIATMRLSTSGVFSGPFLPFASPVSMPLPGGARTVNVEIFDRAGNRTTASATLPLATLTVAGGAATTSANPVAAVLTVPAGAGVQFVVDDTNLVCATATGFALAGGTTVNTNVALAGGEGPKTVSACVRDAAGNVVQVARAITLDTTGPQNAFVFIDAGAAVSLDRDITVNIAAPGDATQMAVAEGLLDCATASYGNVSTSASLTLAPGAAPAEGERTVSVCLRDAAGNTARFTDTIYVDSFNPTGTMRVDVDGDAFVRSTNVTLFVDNAAADVVTAAFANGTINCATATFQPFSAGVAFALPAGEGAKTIAGCLRDQAGRTSTLNATVTLDSVPPAASVTIGGGGAFTTITGITANVVGDGGSGFGFAAGVGALDCAATTYAAFDGNEPRALTLTGADGTKTVSACVRDPAGNTTLATATVILDRAAPDALLLGCATCNANASGALVTNVRNHTLEVDAADDTSAVETVRVALRDPNGVTTTTDVAFAAAVPITLADVNGAHTVSVSFIDSAGLLSSPALTLTITLDRSAPSATLVLVGTPNGTLTRNLAITAQATSASADAASLAVSNDPTFSGATFVGFTGAPVGHTLLPGDGSKTVFLRLRDFAGNESPNISANITLDQTPPAAPTVLILNGAAVTRNLTNSVAYGAQGVTQMRISLDGVFDTEPFINFVASRDETFSAGDGLKNVFVIYRDAAGNETAAVNDSILLDRTAPSGVSFSINGGAAFTRSNSVTLALAASGADFMRIATDGNAADEALVSFTTASTILLAAAGGDGTKTVDVTFEDAAGNQTAAPQRSIVLDTQAPTGPQLGTAPVRTTAGTTDPLASRTFDVTVNVRGTDGNGVTHQVIGGTLTDWTAIATPPGSGAFVHTFTLPAEGVFNLGVRAVDPAGNISAEDFVAIVRDNTAPAAPAGLALVPKDGEVALTFTAVAGDVAGYRVFYGTNDPASTDKTDYNGGFADQGDSPIDIGLNTSFTLTGLPNNTEVAVTIEAYDTTTDDGGLAGSAPNRSPILAGQEAVPNPVTPLQVSFVAGAGDLALFAAVAAQGDRVYTNMASQGFRVWDVSDPFNPTVIGSTAAFAEDFSMTAWGKFVYLTDGGSGNGIRAVNVEIGRIGALQSFAFSNGANRRYAGFVPTGRFGYGAARPDAVGATWTLVKLQASTDLLSGIWSESSTLVVTGGQPACVDANARKVVVGEFEDNTDFGHLRIFNTNPDSTAAPTLFTTINFDRADVRDVELVGRRAYVGLSNATVGGQNGMAIVDVNGGFINSIISGFNCISLTVAGRHVYCADNPSNGTQGERLVVIDVGDAANPKLVGRVGGAPGASELSGLVTVGAGSIFGVEISGGGLVGHEIVKPSNVAKQGSNPGNFDNVAVHGPIAYAAGDLDNGGLRLLDIGNPADPNTITSVSAATLACAGGITTGLVVQRHYLALQVENCAGSNFDDRLYIIDVSDQFGPIVVGSNQGNGANRFSDPALYGNAMFSVNSSGNGTLESWRIWHIDVTEPDGPVLERELSLASGASGGGGPVVQDGVAYVQGQFGALTSIDVRDPDNSGTMTVIGTANSAGQEDLVIAGDTLFCSVDSTTQGLTAFDVSNPAAMAELAQDPDSDFAGEGFRIVKFGRYLFVRNSAFEDGFRVLDVSDPTRFVIVSENHSVPQPFPELGNVAAEGTALIIGADDGGVHVLDLAR